MAPRVTPLAVAGLLLCLGIGATGCSNQGSSNGPNARGGNSNYTPAGLLPSNNHASTTRPATGK